MSVGHEPEVVSRAMLELQAADYAVRLATDDNERREEAGHIEVLLHLLSIPDSSVLGFQCLSAARFGIDGDDFLTADVFGLIVHGVLLIESVLFV
jgi:hypothetical protein